MSEYWVPALIAAVGATIAAAIGVLGTRGRLHRVEVIARILKDLPVGSPVHGSLSELLSDDADELLRARRSPVSLLFWFSALALVLALILTTFGEAILDWSSPVYLTLALGLFVVFLLVVAGLLIVIVAVSIRWVRAAIRWRRARRSRSADEFTPEMQ